MHKHKPNVISVEVVKQGRKKSYHVTHWSTRREIVRRLRTLKADGTPLKRPVVTETEITICEPVVTIRKRRKSARKLGAAV